VSAEWAPFTVRFHTFSNISKCSPVHISALKHLKSCCTLQLQNRFLARAHTNTYTLSFSVCDSLCSSN
jgi:hypothetical protein